MDPEIIRRQQQAARQAGLDALISISPENIAYTTGFPIPSQSLMRWRHAICVVPASGEPGMVVVVLDRIRPGADTGEISRAFLETFAALGYAPISFVGHGIGVHLHEEPYLGRYQAGRLAPGMVLGVEPLVYIPGRFGLQNKDMVLVTEGGAELLSDRTDAERLFPVP
jgi:Xaa-Pro aminopeptidase